VLAFVCRAVFCIGLISTAVSYDRKKFVKFASDSFFQTSSWFECYKTKRSFNSPLTLQQNKLERLTLTNIFSWVYYLLAGQEPTQVEHLMVLFGQAL
jgi:hypothetical protein